MNKDAREQLALSTQVAMLSNHPNIYIYNGIGKYNRMVNFEEHEIGLAILHYTPNMDDTTIDLGRITPQVNNTILENDYIEVDLISAGEGFAFYHKETKELILAVVRRVNAGKHKIYYKGEIYSFNRLSKNNKAIFINTYADIYGSGIGNVGIIEEYNGNLDSIIDFSKEINDFFYIDIVLSHNNYGIINMTEGVIDNTLSNLGSITSLSGVITVDLYSDILAHNNVYQNINTIYGIESNTNSNVNSRVILGGSITDDIYSDILVYNNFYQDTNAIYGIEKNVNGNIDSSVILGGVITDDLYINTLVHNNIYSVIEGNYSDSNNYNVGINQSVNITHLIQLFVEEDIEVNNNIYSTLESNYGDNVGVVSTINNIIELERYINEPTETPTIEFQTTRAPNGMEYLDYRFRNNDRQQVVVYYTFDMNDIEVNNPMGSVVIPRYSATRWYGLGCTVGNCNVFIAAYAKAVNKDKSNITNDWRS